MGRREGKWEVAAPEGKRKWGGGYSRSDSPPSIIPSAIRRGGHTHLGALSEHRESIIFIRNLYESLPSSSAGNPGHRERTHSCTCYIIRLPLANACLVWVLSWVMSAALKLCPMQTCDTPPGNQGGIYHMHDKSHTRTHTHTHTHNMHV